MLNHKQNNVARVSNATLTPGAAYRVVVYPIGAIATASGSSNIHSVRAGHSLKVGNYVMVGTDNSIVRRVTAVTQTTYTSVPAHATSEGDKIVNLGDDPTAAWTGSTVKIYNEPSGASTERDDSQIVTDSNGDYEYWTRGQDVWELILDSTNTPVAVVAGIGNGDGRRNIVDYGAAGDGSVDDSTALTSAVLAGPGTIYFPGGTYLFDTAPATITQTGIILQGDGYDDSIINTSIAAGDAIKVDVEGAGNDGVFTARDIGFVQVTNALTSGSAVVNIEFAAKLTLDTLRVQGTNGTDLMSVGTAIRLSEVNAGWIYDVYLRGEDLYRIGVGMDVCQGVIANRGNITMFGGLYERCTVGVRIASGATKLVNNIQLLGVKLLLSGSAPQDDGVGIQAESEARGLCCYGVHIENYANSVTLDSVDQAVFDGCNISGFSAAAGNGIAFDFDATCRNIRVANCDIGNNTGAAGTTIAFDFDASAHQGFHLGPNRLTEVFDAINDLSVGGTNNLFLGAGMDFDGFEFGNSGKFNGALTVTGNLVFQDQLNFAAPTALTLDTNGVVTLTQAYHTITPFGGAGSVNDSLETITAAAVGDLIILRPTTTAAAGNDQITVVDTGNIVLTGAADFVMDHANDHIVLLGISGGWVELSRASNG